MRRDLLELLIGLVALYSVLVISLQGIVSTYVLTILGLMVFGVLLIPRIIPRPGFRSKIESSSRYDTELEALKRQLDIVVASSDDFFQQTFVSRLRRLAIARATVHTRMTRPELERGPAGDLEYTRLIRDDDLRQLILKPDVTRTARLRWIESVLDKIEANQ